MCFVIADQDLLERADSVPGAWVKFELGLTIWRWSEMVSMPRMNKETVPPASLPPQGPRRSLTKFRFVNIVDDPRIWLLQRSSLSIA